MSYLINFSPSNTRGMESYWFLHFLHVSTTEKIIEKLARINEVSSLAAAANTLEMQGVFVGQGF